MKGPFHLPPGQDAFSFVLFQSTGVCLEAGHQVELLENGAVFERMLEDIRRARESIHVLVYIWRPSPVSDRLVEALRERVSAGVRCRVVVDPVGSEEVRGDKDFDQKVERRLTECGVEVHYYRPLAGKVMGRLLGRNHQKLVIVDGRIGYTGGFGIWKVWDGDGRHARGVARHAHPRRGPIRVPDAADVLARVAGVRGQPAAPRGFTGAVSARAGARGRSSPAWASWG